MKHILLYTVLFVIFLVSCQQDDHSQDRQQADQNNETNRIEHVKDSDPSEIPEASSNEIAQHLSELAARVPDVDEATTIIAGPYAIVAIDVNDTLDSARVGTVKYSVSEALYKDQYGKTAIVIADAGLIERFKEMNRQINAGHPVRGIVDELAAIVGRYMPVLPAKEQGRQQIDENKEQMSDEEDEQIEEIREDHSNSDKYE